MTQWIDYKLIERRLIPDFCNQCKQNYKKGINKFHSFWTKFYHV